MKCIQTNLLSKALDTGLIISYKDIDKFFMLNILRTISIIESIL